MQGRTPRGGTPGTTFVVKNLFYNAPVRLKFLRSDASESAQISAIVAHYALAYPHIRWTLLMDGRLSLQTPGTGQLLDAVIELYGLDVARQLLPVDDTAGEGEQTTRITGLVSQPALHRAARSAIHLFVNRRWVQARGQLAFVIEEAYHTLLMKGRHPLAVLNIEVDPGAVDVNVHPTKSEVKFLHEPQVFALIGRAVRAALADHIQVLPVQLPAPSESAPRRIELRPAAAPRDMAPVWEPAPASAEEAAAAPAWDSSPASADESSADQSAAAPAWESDADADSLDQPSPPRSTWRAPVATDDLAAPSQPRPAWPPPAERPAPPTFRPDPRPAVQPPRQMPLGLPAQPSEHAAPRGPTALPPLRVVGQVSDTYIVAEASDGLYLVDQHAAHERIVYERLMLAAEDSGLDQQLLLIAARPALPPPATALLGGHVAALAAWGFTLAVDDEGLAVTAVPAGLLEAEIEPALLELADQLADGAGSTPDDWREQALTTVACHSAIRAGQPLAHEEMRQLLQQLERCAFPRTCPHGRPTALLLSQSQLERQFGRKG